MARAGRGLDWVWRISMDTWTITMAAVAVTLIALMAFMLLRGRR